MNYDPTLAEQDKQDYLAGNLNEPQEHNSTWDMEAWEEETLCGLDED